MNNFWKGAFVKHRDDAHSDWVSHELDNGGGYEVSSFYVMVDADPITYRALVPSERYYPVVFRPHAGKAYVYLVPATADNTKPTKAMVTKTIADYAKNPVSFGRNVMDFIDIEQTTESHLEDLRRLYREDPSLDSSQANLI